MKNSNNSIGTVITCFDSPRPSDFSFVASIDEVHRGQYVMLSISTGKLIALITDVIKTNKYFENAESVKEFNSNSLISNQFPVAEWQYLVAKCKPLGFFVDGKVKKVTFAPSPGTEVFLADASILSEFLGFSDNGLHLGNLEFHDVAVQLNLSRLLQKHLAILAMSGYGKTYGVKVLLEEILEQKKDFGRISGIVFDVHGDYTNLAFPPEKNEKNYSDKIKLIKANEIKIAASKLTSRLVASFIPSITSIQKRELSVIFNSLKNKMRSGSGPFDFRDLMNNIINEDSIKENTKRSLISWLTDLNSLGLFSAVDNPSLNELLEPGKIAIIDLSEVISLRKKQIILTYFAQSLFFKRRLNEVPPFVLVLEEAHQFCSEGSSKENTLSRPIIETIAREGRKFGVSLCLISQRPIQLSTTVLSQCGTHLILRITNPYDLEHIGKSSESLDKKSLDLITSLRVGEALIVGEALNSPVFFSVRKKKSGDSKHSLTLSEAALKFEQEKNSKENDAKTFL